MSLSTQFYASCGARGWFSHITWTDYQLLVTPVEMVGHSLPPCTLVRTPPVRRTYSAETTWDTSRLVALQVAFMVSSQPEAWDTPWPRSGIWKNVICNLRLLFQGRIGYLDRRPPNEGVDRRMRDSNPKPLCWNVEWLTHLPPPAVYCWFFRPLLFGIWNELIVIR